jgi:hypothetical protein
MRQYRESPSCLRVQKGSAARRSSARSNPPAANLCCRISTQVPPCARVSTHLAFSPLCVPFLPLSCYELVATELESSEVVLKLLELTGEKPDAATGFPAPSPSSAAASTVAAHVQAMEQLRHRAAAEKQLDRQAQATGAAAGAGDKRSSLMRGLGGADEKKRFTLPSVNKPHLFALKNSERELWLHAENTETRLEWVNAIRGIQKRKAGGPSPRGGGSTSTSSSSDPKRARKPDAPSWEIEYSAVSVLNKVGVGAFGEVFRARLWGTEVACKTLKVGGEHTVVVH